MATIPQEQDFQESVDAVTTMMAMTMMDELVRRGLSRKLRRVRRKPGLEQLGSQDDGAAITAPHKQGHNRANTWANEWRQAVTLPTSLSEPQLLRRAQGYIADAPNTERRKQKLGEQRTLWESTLPKTPSDHMGYFSTGHHLDHVHPDETPPS